MESLYRALLAWAHPDNYATPIGRAFAKLVWISILVTVFPVVFGCIYLDRCASWNPFVAFPRNTKEARQRPERLFRYLRGRGVVPASATLITLRDSGSGSEMEPDKNVSVLRTTIVFRTEEGGAKTEIEVFIKMATERPWPTWIRAFGSAFGTMSKEVGFHSEIVPSLRPFPVSVPECLCADWSRLFDRAITVSRLDRGRLLGYLFGDFLLRE